MILRTPTENENIREKDSSHPLGMTMTVISNVVRVFFLTPIFEELPIVFFHPIQ